MAIFHDTKHDDGLTGGSGDDIFRHAILRVLPALAAAAAALMLWSAPAQAGAAQSYRVLHDFCKANPCGDGSFPAGDQLLMDVTGKFYGTTFRGGRFDNGTIYEVFPKHGGAKYFKKVLKAFCQIQQGCGVGGKTQSGVIMDTQGNLYGTAPAAGANCGTVYEAVLSGGKYTLNVLHAFASSGGDACDPTSGALAYHGKDAGQLYDGTSPLFGVTLQGGANGDGAVFELLPPKAGRKQWQETVIYSYCQISGCADGSNPTGDVVMDSSDDLYTTAAGAAGGQVFELAPDGSGGFVRQPVYQSATGEQFAFLRITSDGTLYGASSGGGPTNHGTLFKLAPAGGGGFDYTDLHDFCPGGSGHCTDGDVADTVLIDSSGNIWGTTLAGGTNPGPFGSPFPGAGVIFEYTSGGSFAVVHQFCAETNCTDGGTPAEGLVTDGAGHFFGTTALGGVAPSTPTNGNAPLPPAGGGGVLYELSLP